MSSLLSDLLKNRSTLAVIVIISIFLIVWGVSMGNTEIKSLGYTLLWIFGGFFVIFLILTILRNVLKIKF